MAQSSCSTQKPPTSFEQMTRDELLHEAIEFKSKYEALKENPQNIINNVSQNIVMFPNAFGNESTDVVKQKLGDILGPLIKNHTFSSIQTLFIKIHKNEKLPEYHNVYSSSERSSYALVSDGKTFNYRPKKTIIDQIIEDKRSILNEYVDQNGEQLGEKVLRKYERYQNQLDSNSEFHKDLELEIGGLLLDMKSVIANDDKTRILLDKVNDGNFELIPS
jgi:hypothetical protein